MFERRGRRKKKNVSIIKRKLPFCLNYLLLKFIKNQKRENSVLIQLCSLKFPGKSSEDNSA